jgi:hypothetical protein
MSRRPRGHPRLNALDPAGGVHGLVRPLALTVNSRRFALGGGSESGDVRICDVPKPAALATSSPGQGRPAAIWLVARLREFYYQYPGGTPTRTWFLPGLLLTQRPGTTDRYVVGRVSRDRGIRLRCTTGQDGFWSPSVRRRPVLVSSSGPLNIVHQVTAGTGSSGGLGAGDDLHLISRRDASRAGSFASPAARLAGRGHHPRGETRSSRAGGSCSRRRPRLVTYQLGGVSPAFELDGRPAAKPDLAPLSSVQQLAPLDGDTLLFLSSSYVQPPAWYATADGRVTLKIGAVRHARRFLGRRVVRSSRSRKTARRSPSIS